MFRKRVILGLVSMLLCTSLAWGFTRDWDSGDPIDHSKNNTWPAEIREVMVDVAERLTDIFYGLASGETLIGAKDLPFNVQGSDPGATASQIKCYSKDVSAKAELFCQDEDGDVIQVTTEGNLNAVTLTGNQTVAGIKTFSSIPVLPSSNPTTDDQAVRKKYVDESSVVQVVNTQTGALASGTTVVFIDDTIPQNDEGNEFMTLAITPTSASNKLMINVTAVVSASVVPTHIVTALFQDSTSNALADTISAENVSNNIQTVALHHYMTAGTTSETTFKVRIGMDDAGTFRFNGSSGGRVHGGVLASSITITEIGI